MAGDMNEDNNTNTLYTLVGLSIVFHQIKLIIKFHLIIKKLKHPKTIFDWYVWN